MGLQDIVRQREQAQLEEKLAALKAEFGNDENFAEALGDALDFIESEKLAGTSVEKLDLATQLAVDAVTGATKVAAEDTDVANAIAWGEACAKLAFDAGVTTADVEAIASDEEGALFGEMLAVAAAKTYAE